MRCLCFSFLALAVGLMASVSALAQTVSPNGPAAAWLNVVFSVGDSWAMYGAPQLKPLSESEFQALARQVEQTDFPTDVSQVLVMIRDTDVDGTLGLIEKRGKKVRAQMVAEGGQTAFGLWHQVGYSTSPEKMLSEHLDNILAAEDKYPNLPVLFYAPVRRVARDNNDEIYVEFAIRRTPYPLICYPWAGAPQLVDLKSLKGGDRLRVSAQFSSWSPQEGLKLRGCLFSPQ